MCVCVCVYIYIYIYIYLCNIFSHDIHALHNDVLVRDGPHIRQWTHNIIIYNYYNTFRFVTFAYNIQYSNMLYRFVAYEQWAIPYSLGM